MAINNLNSKLLLNLLRRSTWSWDLLLNKTHIRCEGRRWNPSAGVSWVDFLKHTINLLKRKTLGLWDEEVCECDGDDAERSPHEEDLAGKVGVLSIDEVWGDDSNDAVPEPVGGGGETDTTGSDGKGEDFTDNNPSARTPGGSEEGNVDADECDHRLDSGLVGVFTLILTNSDTDNTSDVLGDNHTSSTEDEKVAATNTFNEPESDWGREHVDESGDQRNQEGVLNRAKTVVNLLAEALLLVRNERLRLTI